MAHLFNYSGARGWRKNGSARSSSGLSAAPRRTWATAATKTRARPGGLGVMMAIGLFQVSGGAEVDPVYEITSPIFDRVTIHLDPDYYPGGKFVIVARTTPRENRYIQSAALNGRPSTRPWFYHRESGQRGQVGAGPRPRAEQALGEPSRGRPALDDAGDSAAVGWDWPAQSESQFSKSRPYSRSGCLQETRRLI